MDCNTNILRINSYITPKVKSDIFHSVVKGEQSSQAIQMACNHHALPFVWLGFPSQHCKRYQFVQEIEWVKCTSPVVVVVLRRSC